MSRNQGEPKKLEGMIILTRPQGGGKERVVFQIVDEISSLVAFKIEMSIPDFGEMLSSPRNVPCIIEHFQSGDIGKKREQKTEIIPRPPLGRDRPAEVAKILKPYEVDGWFGSVSDATNPHRWIGQDKVKVGFVRWVEPKEGDDNV